NSFSFVRGARGPGKVASLFQSANENVTQTGSPGRWGGAAAPPSVPRVQRGTEGRRYAPHDGAAAPSPPRPPQITARPRIIPWYRFLMDNRSDIRRRW